MLFETGLTSRDYHAASITSGTDRLQLMSHGRSPFAGLLKIERNHPRDSVVSNARRGHMRCCIELGRRR